MINTQTIKNGLLDLRAMLVQKHERISSELPELEQQITAIDLLIKKQFENVELDTAPTNEQGDLENDIFVDENQREEPSNINGSATLSNGNGRIKLKGARKGTLRDTARKHFNELPKLFTKNDVASLVERYHEALNGNAVNENSLFGVLRDLVKRDFAKIKVASAGTKAQIYEKIV